MSVVEETQSKVNKEEVETTGLMLQEILLKLESFDSRLVAMENSQGKGVRGMYSSEEEGESVDKRLRNQDISVLIGGSTPWF